MVPWRPLVTVAIGFCESLIFSGLIFGWPSLVHVLQIEGVYSHLCLTGEDYGQNATSLLLGGGNNATGDDHVIIVRCWINSLWTIY